MRLVLLTCFNVTYRGWFYLHALTLLIAAGTLIIQISALFLSKHNRDVMQWNMCFLFLYQRFYISLSLLSHISLSLLGYPCAFKNNAIMSTSKRKKRFHLKSIIFIRHLDAYDQYVLLSLLAVWYPHLNNSNHTMLYR